MLLLALSLLAAAQSGRVPAAPVESLAVSVSGRGEPVVLIPGLFGTAYGYRKLVPLLHASGYRSIVVEPLGIGSSARLKDADYSLTAQADRIAAVLDTLGVRGAVVVAHSLGASIALRLSARRPDLARAVVSLEGGPAEAATTTSFRRWLSLAPLSRLFNGATLMQRMIHRDLIRSSADTTWIDEELVRRYVSGDLEDFGATMDAYRGMARAEEPEMLRDRLAQIDCPVFLLVGAAPHKGGPRREEIALLDSLLPSLTIDTVPESGHFIQEERPQAVVEAVQRASMLEQRDCR
jgi:pimeloyl-ACP methyl ester carboxylesterase